MVRRDSIWKSLDWVTIIIYLMLIVFGWFSICGASYDYGDRDFLDFSTRAGKQFMWIVCSFGLGFILLMLEDTLYDMFSYIIYIGVGQVYERLFVHYKKLEERVDAGFPYSSADDADYSSAGNGVCIGLYGFLPDALS